MRTLARLVVLLAVLLLSVPVSAGIGVGEPERVSLGVMGEQLDASNGLSGWGLSADGSRVVFTTTDGAFVRDPGARTTVAASVLPDGRSGVSPTVVGVSRDASRVVFALEADNTWRLFLRDMTAAMTVELSPNVPLDADDPLPESRLPANHFFRSGWEYSFSAFGDLESVEVRREAVAEPAGVPGTALTSTGIGEVYRFNVATTQRTLASEYSWYSAPNCTGCEIYRGTPYLGSRSADGRWSVFFSTESETPDDLDPPARYNGPPRGDFFLHDFATGATRLITGTMSAQGASQAPLVSDDGRRVVFSGGAWEAGSGALADTLFWVPGVPVLWHSGLLERLTDLPVGARVDSGDLKLERLGVLIDGLAFVYEVSSGNLVPLSSSTAGAVWVSAEGPTAMLATSLGGEVAGLFIVPIEALPFDDISGSIFADDIVWLAGQGIKTGCNPEGTMFCLNDPVARGQMAAFLTLALKLPVPSGGDRFVDDAGRFEAYIEALAAAGITRGCSADGTRFCPNEPVTRGQMAAFLARALSLPDGAPSTFSDDGGSIFAADIARIAEAGITRGCTPDGTKYCPEEPVTRGQMAAFLHRALGS